jgi:hypothetical protein
MATQPIVVFAPILEFLKTRPVDTQLQYALSKRFPLASEQIQQIKEWCLTGLQEKSFRMRGPQNLRFGNLLHQKRTPFQFRIDIVDMDGQGPGHVHPLGEINLCFTTENTGDGSTSFDGLSEGWVVKQPNSWHTPRVQHGRMVIVYFLPRGKVLFD